MTISTTNYPKTITQATGGHNRIFQDLGNLKKNDDWIRSKYAIPPRNKGTYYKPSKLTVTNYGFKLPTDARVRKITVIIRHLKRGACTKGTPNDAYPCTSAKSMSNIGAPVVNLKNAGKLSDQKVSAPTKNSTQVQTTFKVDLPASNINSSKFGVTLDYPSNTNTHYGFVYVKYIAVKLEYITPSYGLSLKKVTGCYNHEEITFEATCSNPNLAQGSPVTVLTAPRGLSFKSWSGNGKITSRDARTIEWRPNIGLKTGSVKANFTFESNVTYDVNTTSWNAQMIISLSNYNNSNALCNFTIIDRPAEQSTETDSTSSTSASIQEEYTQFSQINCLINETVEGTLELNNEETLSWITKSYEQSDLAGWFELYIPEEDAERIGLKQEDAIHYLLDGEYDPENTLFLFTISLSRLGIYNVPIYVRGEYANDDEMASVIHYNRQIGNIILNVMPPETDLTIPNMAILSLSEEELNRLGDGSTYILQSHLKLLTDEDAVRDWYKNFRIGVFNHAISENLIYEYNYEVTEDTITLDISALNQVTDNQKVEIIPSVPYQVKIYLDNENEDEFIWQNQDVNNPVTNLSASNNPLTIRCDSDELTLDCILYDISDKTNPVKLLIQKYNFKFNQEEERSTESITDPTDYTNLSKLEIFKNVHFWSESVAGYNEFNNVTCEFTYNPDYPLYIVITGDYPEGNPLTNNIEFLEPCIIESDEYVERLSNGNFPVSIIDLLDGGRAELTLPAYTHSNSVTLYDLPLEDNYGTNDEIAIRGLALIGEIEQCDNQVLYATLINPNGKPGTRSIILNDTEKLDNSDYDIIIGGLGDLWGFSTVEMVNLEKFEMKIELANTLSETESNINFGDLKIVLYVEPLEKQDITVSVEDENLTYYGAFIQSFTVPEGLKTDTDFLTIDGTDTNDAYRQNISTKTIEFEFDVGDNCSLKDATTVLRQISKLLTNERDKYNRPIPKKIECSLYPDVYWEYIMEDPLDAEVEISSYHVKAKLTIPAGTSYDKVNTVTSTTGYVQGLANINPILIVKPSANEIEINETVTGQKFNMNLPTSIDWNEGIIEIDCEDRICWFKINEDDINPVNINQYVDFNVDWFSLHGEYQFNSVGCTIRTVDYAERW